MIEAHRAGKLVIFVGAGASRDSPSDLPDFVTLTSEIAAEAQGSTLDEDSRCRCSDVATGTRRRRIRERRAGSRPAAGLPPGDHGT